MKDVLLFFASFLQPLPVIIPQNYYGKQELARWEEALSRLKRIRAGEALWKVVNEEWDYYSSEDEYDSEYEDEDDGNEWDWQEELV